jgi:hypothetical protein
MYDPAVNAPGSFVYTVNGTAPCLRRQMPGLMPLSRFAQTVLR